MSVRLDRCLPCWRSLRHPAGAREVHWCEEQEGAVRCGHEAGSASPSVVRVTFTCKLCI